MTAIVDYTETSDLHIIGENRLTADLAISKYICTILSDVKKRRNISNNTIVHVHIYARRTLCTLVIRWYL